MKNQARTKSLAVAASALLATGGATATGLFLAEQPASQPSHASRMNTAVNAAAEQEKRRLAHPPASELPPAQTVDVKPDQNGLVHLRIVR